MDANEQLLEGQRIGAYGSESVLNLIRVEVPLKWVGGDQSEGKMHLHSMTTLALIPNVLVPEDEMGIVNQSILILVFDALFCLQISGECWKGLTRV
jgi:hypothetical protein